MQVELFWHEVSESAPLSEFAAGPTPARLHQMLEGNLHLANHPGKTLPMTLPNSSAKNTAKKLYQKTEERESCLQKIEKTG